MQHPDENSRNSPYASPQADSRRGSTFSLATLMAVVVLCAVGFGIMYYAIGLGVAFFIIAALVFVRVKVHHRTAWVTGIGASAVSALLMGVLLPICCTVAFFTNCLAGAFAAEQLYGGTLASLDRQLTFAFGLGSVSALQTGELIVALLLSKR